MPTDAAPKQTSDDNQAPVDKEAVSPSKFYPKDELMKTQKLQEQPRVEITKAAEETKGFTQPKDEVNRGKMRPPANYGSMQPDLDE